MHKSLNFKTEQTQITVLELINSLNEYEIAPPNVMDLFDFKTSNMTLIIENLLIGFPLPTIFIESSPGYPMGCCIYGGEILLSISNFINNLHPISPLSILDSNKSLYFKELEIEYQNKILNALINIHIISAPQINRDAIIERIIRTNKLR